MRRIAIALVAALAVLSYGGQSAYADDGTGLSIGHVEPGDDNTIQVLVSVPADADVDPSDITVSIGDAVLDSSAERAGTTSNNVRRTTVIAFDTSDSMSKNGRIDAARAAATTFLASAPKDVYVGIVTFDREVETVLAPTTDRDAAQEVVDGLELASQTRLNDGVIEAVAQAGTEGQRRILVLSDGRDTSKTPESDVTAAIKDADVAVDVVALDQSGSSLAPLRAMSDAGSGSVIAADADALESAFAAEADALARQVLVTATLPSEVTGNEATVTVAATVDGRPTTASSYAVIRNPDDGAGATVASSSDGAALTITRPMMFGGLLAMGLGLLVLVTALLVPKRSASTAEQRILAYGAAGGGDGSATHRSEAPQALDQAKDAAAKVLKRNTGLEQKINQRLEAAGSALKPAEWLLIHSAVTVVGGLVGMLLGGGNFLLLLAGAAVGWLLPKLWLARKRKRRLKAFNSQLSDTLQLIAGSLSAGMSLAQSIDTVVREGQEPVSGEFKRVLVETRLGVSIDDALEGIAQRLESADFAWVVMAIRIQRQVGGNLAELLTTVAGTLRERDYLRRQIRSLAAEGRLSAYILAALPPGIAVFLLMTRYEYIAPLFTTGMGFVLLAGAAVLLGMAGFLMSRIVKVEV
ncbi:VWA domain-containing protein [Nocardioides guangzhouensis]|uniref:VWA domain-containing protein n=1 Tax=Nocardioides guangzhouensis TaxID=2497878 RepID=A0A4Q4ZCA3_9ACTN|nr:type II secretion system F family protein [Nocardioides guangzhouensis]RYP85670.1 VWA domain-containing protein [Nocardioides guangzhouensis]